MSERVFDYTGWAAAMSDAVGPAWSFGLYRAIRKVMHKRRHEVIVRCKDCADYIEDKVYGKEVCICTRFGSFWHETEPDGFCAWGVRKEVDDDRRRIPCRV